ncbi:MAG TPA: phage holin family protein [Patescibacteria group bacterium]
MSLIIRILANSAAIWAANRLVPGFVFTGTYVDLFIAGAVLGLINALVRPILNLISFPIIFLTLGLFSLIINIFLLYLAASFLPTLHIQNLSTAFWGLIVISLVNNLVTHLSKQKD